MRYQKLLCRGFIRALVIFIAAACIQTACTAGIILPAATAQASSACSCAFETSCTHSLWYFAFVAFIAKPLYLYVYTIAHVFTSTAVLSYVFLWEFISMTLFIGWLLMVLAFQLFLGSVCSIGASSSAWVMVALIFAILVILVIIRGGAPRYRIEQLSRFNFNILLPAFVSFVIVLIIAIILL